MRNALLLLLALILCVGLIDSLSLTGPTWTPSSPQTNNTLNCSWTLSGDATEQNITIYNGSTLYNATYQNTTTETLMSSIVLDSSLTRKGETWTCNVTLYNLTDSTQAIAQTTILNTPPTTGIPPGGVYNDSGVDVGTLIQIWEDTTLVLDVNATDQDNDALTYLAASSFCSFFDAGTGETTGIYSCTPTQSNIVNNSPTLKNISFFVQDGQEPGGRIITFNVTPVNDAPLASVSAQTTPVNASLNYTFSVADEENSFPLTLTISAPAEISDKLSILALDANGTSVSIYYDAAVPDFNDVGLHNITINVTDNSTRYDGQNDSISSLATFTLNITPVGRRPFFLNITPQGPYNLSQGSSIQINITANDSDVNQTILFTDDFSGFDIATLINNNSNGYALGQINYTALNAQVGQFNVTITIEDEETLQNTTVLQFNVTNVNDLPQVEESSYSSANTQSNQDASNLTAYANAPFIYDVNATDPDLLISVGESLAYADNTSLFAINTTTGRISFTPQDANVAATPYHINISATDASGAIANRTFLLTILANGPPVFNATIPQINCTTKSACVFPVGDYVEDPEAGNLTFTMTVVSGSLSSIGYNVSTGLINFTTVKTDYGNNTINITVADDFGSSNSTLVNLSINNTPEAPNLTRYNFSSETIVETFPFSYQLWATDDDLLVSVGEQVNFSTNLSISNTIQAVEVDNTTTKHLLSFTPQLGDAGNHTIEINATDAFGLVDTKIITFQIFAKTPAPNITNITPWGTAPNYTIQTSFANASLFPSQAVTVNASEGLTINFSTIVNSSRPLTYNWTVNGTQNVTSQNASIALGYFSAGTLSVRVNISDDRLEHTIWDWTVLVNNVNRAPQLSNILANPGTVNGTIQFGNYFTAYNGTNFIDPDDDLNSDGVINGSESNSLTFSASTACSFATISISGSTLTVSGTDIGVCYVSFNATDTAGLTLESNTIFINITDVPEDDSEETQAVSSSGGGGGSTTTSRIVPLSRDASKPQAFHLITPRLVTIYSNNSVEIPVTLNNTWTTPLKFVQLSAEMNETGVTTSFDMDFFEEIPMNGSVDAMITVTNYRLGENYEVIVRANVSDPDYADEALVLLNSIEQANEGDDVDVKVTFANDLLNQHPECQELNEVLDDAKQQLSQNNYAEARRLVDGVINGCKYLVSTQQQVNESPSKINPIINLGDLPVRVIMWSVLVFVIVLSLALLVYYHYSYRPEEDI